MCGGPSLASIAPIVSAAAPIVGSLIKGVNVPAAPQPVAAPVAPTAPKAVEPAGVLDQERLRARALRRASQTEQRNLVNLSNQSSQSQTNTLLGS